MSVCTFGGVRIWNGIGHRSMRKDIVYSIEVSFR